jgi:hypothetical protein
LFQETYNILKLGFFLNDRFFKEITHFEVSFLDLFSFLLFQGSYNLKWDFNAAKPDGQREVIACAHLAIKIV